MSLFLNLDKQKIPGIKKIIKLENFDEFFTPDKKLLFGVTYFIYKSNQPIVVRFSSESKSFSRLYGIDFFGKNMKPVAGMIFKDDESNENIEKFVLEMMNDLKPVVTENKTLRDEYFDKIIINEINPFKTIMKVGRFIADMPIDVKVQLGFFGFIMGLTAVAKWWYLIKKVIIWSKEKYVEGPLEKKLNNELFKGQQKNEPAYAMYSRLVDFITHIIHGKQPAFIICGPPGMSKTYIVKRTFHFEKLSPGRDYRIEKGGALGTAEVYSMLYYNRKKILILDDFDTPLMDPEMVNLLKAITDSYDRRIISYPREKKTEVGGEGSSRPSAPSKFEFKGKLIIITNLPKDKIDPALLSRAPALEVNFDTKEVLSSLEKLLRYVNPKTPIEIKREVLDYIISLYKKNPSIHVDFRSFKSSVDAKEGNVYDWKGMVETIVGYK